MFCKDTACALKSAVTFLQLESDRYLWLYGGFGREPGEFLSDLWRYDTVTQSWSDMSSTLGIFDIGKRSGARVPGPLAANATHTPPASFLENVTFIQGRPSL
jgi:hypothetical protein